MKRLMLILPVAAALLSGCAVYEPGPVYPASYYAPPPRPVYAYPTYGYPSYAPPAVYGSVWFGGGHGGHGGGRGWGHWR